MKSQNSLIPVTKNSTLPNSFYLVDNPNKVYPYLKFKKGNFSSEDVRVTEGEEKDNVRELLTSDLSSYINGNYEKILTNKSVKDIINLFFTNWSSSKISDNLKVTYNLLNTSLTKLSNTTSVPRVNYLDVKNFQVEIDSETKSVEEWLIDLAKDFNWKEKEFILYEDLRETTKINFSGTNTNEVTLLVDKEETKINQVETNNQEIYEDLNSTINKWEVIKDSSNNQGVTNHISLDLSRTLGSVVPLFNQIRYAEGYNTLIVSILWSEYTEPDILYKETFNLFSDFTGGISSENKNGTQIVWSNPNKEDSVIKIVWDDTLVHAARITNIKLARVNT